MSNSCTADTHRSHGNNSWLLLSATRSCISAQYQPLPLPTLLWPTVTLTTLPMSNAFSSNTSTCNVNVSSSFHSEKSQNKPLLRRVLRLLASLMYNSTMITMRVNDLSSTERLVMSQWLSQLQWCSVSQTACQHAVDCCFRLSASHSSSLCRQQVLNLYITQAFHCVSFT